MNVMIGGNRKAYIHWSNLYQKSHYLAKKKGKKANTKQKKTKKNTVSHVKSRQDTRPLLLACSLSLSPSLARQPKFETASRDDRSPKNTKKPIYRAFKKKYTPTHLLTHTNGREEEKSFSLLFVVPKVLQRKKKKSHEERPLSMDSSIHPSILSIIFTLGHREIVSQRMHGRFDVWNLWQVWPRSLPLSPPDITAVIVAYFEHLSRCRVKKIGKGGHVFGRGGGGGGGGVEGEDKTQKNT